MLISKIFEPVAKAGPIAKGGPVAKVGLQRDLFGYGPIWAHKNPYGTLWAHVEKHA